MPTMPSHLKHQASFAPVVAATTASKHPAFLSPPQKKQRMSISQTYYLAHTARGKLSAEAARGDHNLRRLVGHANLLDSLMLDLQDAEREQEAWLEATVKANKADDKDRRVKWVDTFVEDNELDIPDASDDEEEDSDDEDEDELDMTVPLRRVKSPPAAITQHVYDDDEEEEILEDDDDYSDEDLTLTRTSSHASHPPELVSDSEDSDDDSAPTSPPAPANLDFPPTQLQTSQKPQQAPRVPASASQSLLDDGFYIPERPASIPSAPMVAAY